MLKLACLEHNKEKGLYIILNEWEGTQKYFFNFPYIHNKFKDEIDQVFSGENLLVLYVCGGDLFAKAKCYHKNGYVGIARPGFKINFSSVKLRNIFVCNDKKYTGFYSDATMAIKMARENGQSIEGLTYDSVAKYLHDVVHWI